MATLIDFTTAYRGGPSYYTGAGVTSLVPDVFPVAIGGHAYMIDMKSQQFGRAFEARLRDSSDDSNIPGEASLNAQGLWRRSQVSWHKGSGQEYADTAGGVDTRFNTSKNVDVWTKGKLSLLNSTTRVLSSANTNLKMVVANGYLYVGDGNTLKYTANPNATSPSWTSVTTGAPASAAVEALATDGSTVYIAYNNNSLYSSTAGSSSVALIYPSSGSTAYTFTLIEYVKGRIVSAHDNDIHTNLTGAKSAFFSHPNTSFKWVGFAAGQNAIFAGGYAGQTSLIYKITIKADGTLDVPIVAGELPLGEVIYSLNGYLGYVVIGTDKGIRLATADDLSNLVIGPVLESSNPVRCAVGSGRFVWYGWTNFDATSTGLGRLDLSELNGVNEPAYASDLMADVQGNVQDVVNWGDQRIFSVAGQGVYAEKTSVYATSGYVDTGSWRWGIPDKKFAAFIDFRTLPLRGSVMMSYKYDGGAWEDIATFNTPTATEITFDAKEEPFGEAAFKLTLNADNTTVSGVTTSYSPFVTRWQVRAFPAPQRSEIFSVPVLLHQRLSQFGRDYPMDTLAELEFLRDLIKNARVVSYQEGLETHKVLVENVQWVPIDYGQKPYEFDGTAIVTLRSLAA